jgi:predicted enzyme related to lactoylglutathione lyase
MAMPDPFTELRADDRPVAPDPVFARRLRARLERALALPRGVAPVTTLEEHTQPRYRHGDVGYVSLDVRDADRAYAFYTGVLGWELERRGAGWHSRGVLPSTGVAAWMEPNTVFCCYAVDDVVAAAERVRAAGGTAGDPHDHPYGRVVDCVDDQGTRFALYEQPDAVQGPRPPANGRRPGDLSYLTLEVVDSARARAFYGAVLGWQFRPGRIVDGWQVADTVPMIGISGGHPRARAVPMWSVADIEDAVAAVRAAGGTATDPERQPYGSTSDCTDDEGLRFYLGQL